MAQKKEIVRSIRFDTKSKYILEKIGLLDHIGRSKKVRSITMNRFVNMCIQKVIGQQLGKYENLPTVEQLQDAMDKIEFMELTTKNENILHEIDMLQVERKIRYENQRKKQAEQIITR